MLELVSPLVSVQPPVLTYTINQPGDNVFIVRKKSYVSAQLLIVMAREDGSQHVL